MSKNILIFCRYIQGLFSTLTHSFVHFKNKKNTTQESI